MGRGWRYRWDRTRSISATGCSAIDPYWWELACKRTNIRQQGWLLRLAVVRRGDQALPAQDFLGHPETVAPPGGESTQPETGHTPQARFEQGGAIGFGVIQAGVCLQDCLRLLPIQTGARARVTQPAVFSQIHGLGPGGARGAGHERQLPAGILGDREKFQATPGARANRIGNAAEWNPQPARLAAGVAYDIQALGGR